MTKIQEDDFLKYGCGSRSLIKLAAIHNKTITQEDFCKRFEHHFPKPETEYGGTITSTLIYIAICLGMCSEHADTLVSPELAKKAFLENMTRGIFLLTEKAKDKNGCLGDFNHCRLLLNWTNDTLLVWQTNPDGKEFEMIVREAELGEQRAHFVLLY